MGWVGGRLDLGEKRQGAVRCPRGGREKGSEGSVEGNGIPRFLFAIKGRG